MPRHRITWIALGLIVSATALAVTPPPQARAQAALIGTCGKILMRYVLSKEVVKSFASAAAKKGGDAVADYFIDKIKRGGAERVEPRDLEVLRNQGISECQARQQIDAMMQGGALPGNYPAPAPTFAAQAYCSATGRTGQAWGLPNPQMALNAAVQNCVQNGGILECCRNGAQLVR